MDTAVGDELIRFLELQNLAVKRFEPEMYNGPVALFRSADLQTGLFRDPLLGWGKHVREGLVVHEIPGGHSDMFLEPTVAILAEKLAGWLSRSGDLEEAGVTISVARQ